MVYFVDRENIERQLALQHNALQFLHAHHDAPPATQADCFAWERAMHLCIETVLDVGNQMIDGFIMRDPGSYADIIDILVDEAVISDADGQSLQAIIELRRMLVREYIHVDHDHMWHVYRQHEAALGRFRSQIKRYFDRLGPVNAFYPSDGSER